MKLQEALTAINSRNHDNGPAKIHYLACGFEPLHLATFFKAHLLERLPNNPVEVLSGIYGDLPGNLTSAAESRAIAAAVVMEWSDLDPRLGLRSSGGWSADVKGDIPNIVRQRLAILEASLQKLASKMPAAIAPPSLPLPPIGSTISAHASALELEIEAEVAAFLLRLARCPGVRILHHSRTESFPCADGRLDAKMELLAGFPYTIPFASALAGALADVLWQRPPKKGLITDLDDTLWSGIVGEVGTDAVSWSQDRHTQVHGLYQQMLGHLADCGVLLAVCSKNEQSTAEAALAREDLLLKSASLFPVCANWEPKSQSVARILRAWNIGEDAVVFVDDSPLELEEVKKAYPGITCLSFPKKDPAKVWRLLGELRDLFGKPVVLDEDRLRQSSLRAGAQFQEVEQAASSSDFLQGLEGVVTLDWRLDPSDQRPLELINKTNQFNLNGCRIAEGEWRRILENPATVLAVVSYSDKFGPLGKIAVLVGSQSSGTVNVSHWVMSCRAFSRRLEHHTLNALFDRYGINEVTFAFQPTDKNKPLCDFLNSIGAVADSSLSRISRDNFLSRCGLLPHQLRSMT